MITVGQLRKAIADLPDDMPVLVQAECSTRDPNLYVIPAHIEHTTYGSHVWEDHHTPNRFDAEYGRRYENTTALLISEWGNDGVDITPESAPSVVDGELAPPELEAR